VITQGPSDFSLVSLHGVRAIAEGLNPRPELMILFPQHLDDALDDHVKVGLATRHMPEALDLVDALRARIGRVEQTAKGATRRLVGFVQWLDPLFCGGYWIPQLIEIAGGVDAFNKAGLSPTHFDWHELRQRNPEILIIACEDMSIERVRSEMRVFTDRAGWDDLVAHRQDHVFIGDGRIFTRASPRLVQGLEALAWAINPKRFPEPPPEVLQKFRD
jgi:iron complex transport system substrate-binding protein